MILLTHKPKPCLYGFLDFYIKLMTITPTHITYYFICKRKLWLFSNHIQMEQESDLVFEGNLISENTYNRRSKQYTELDLGVAKIDFYDAKNKIIHEVKKSNKLEEAHIWQVKYYILLLERADILGAIGVLEYPKLRVKQEVVLSSIDKDRLNDVENHIIEILKNPCPPPIHSKICKSCSYQEFCYA